MTQHYTYITIIIESNFTDNLIQVFKEITMELFQDSYLFTFFLQS